MALLPQQDTIQQWIATDSQTDYEITFYAPLSFSGEPAFNVYVQAPDADAIPESDIKTWNTDYTYTPYTNEIDGGVLTFLAGHIPTNGYVVTVSRNVPAELNAEFSNAANFSGITLDEALDQLLLISQQNKSYALQRNLSYIVNSYLPSATLERNTQIPVLGPNEVWFGSAGGVIAAELEQPADVSTLRSELANEADVTNGASLVGYYDDVNTNPTTVAAQLTLLTNAVYAVFPAGTIIDFAGTSAPAGFYVCDGSAKDTTTDSVLFAAIGYTWGGAGSTFLLPDLRGTVTAGSGGTLPPLDNTVGSRGGEATEALSNINQVPLHTHNNTAAFNTSFLAGNAITGSTTGVVRAQAIETATTPSLGSITMTNAPAGQATPESFSIVQPTAIVLKCIKF